MSDWRELTDQMIRDAMRAGKFSRLKGEGRPLKLDDDPSVPDALRLAFKILRDNDLAPEWVMEGEELAALREQMIAALRAAARACLRGGARTEARWQRARAIFSETAALYNRKLLSFNLKLPPGVARRPMIDVEREIDRALAAARNRG